MNRFGLALICGLLLGARSTIVSTCAADTPDPNGLKGMWQSNVVTNFDVKPQANSSKQIEFAHKPMGLPMAQEEFAEPVKVASAQANQATQPTQVNEEQKAAEVPKSREDIYKKYGSPNEPLPVKAIKDAPISHQALFECVRIGDDQCAFEYAQQAAKFNQSVADTVGKVTDWIMVGQEANGMRSSPEEEDGPMTPERAKAAKFLREAKKQLAAQKLDVNETLKGAEAVVPDEDSVYQKEKLLNQTPTTPVPVDPQGKAKLLVFFNENAYPEKELNETLKPLKKLVGADRNLQVVGFTAKSYTSVGLKRISTTTSFPFPLLSGEALSKELLISRYPTFIFVAPSIKQQYRLEGLRSTEEIEKVIRLMQGGK